MPAFFRYGHGSNQPGQVWILLPPVFDVWSAVIDPGDNKKYYKRILNSSTVRPASLMIPPIVKASTGFDRGMVIILTPSVIVICFPCLATQNPRFSNAATALL
jgi:hypothetical protein